MAISSLQSPGPGYRGLRLSDGSTVWMQPDATTNDWQEAQRQGEGFLDQKYMKQAETENRPIATQGKVYSATVARPNDFYGHLMGWIDHNLGGNELNRSAAGQNIARYGAPAAAAGSRLATAAVEANPYVRAYDLGTTGYNVGKHVLGFNQTPDAPTVLGTLRSMTGTPELPADASSTRQVLENALPMIATGTPPTSALLHAGTSYTGGKIGEAVAGEPGQYVGSFLSPRVIANPLLKTVAPMLQGPQAGDVTGASQRTGIRPTFGQVANPGGRLVEKALGAIPVVGTPIRQAQERSAADIQQGVQDVAENVYGSKLPFVSPGTIGGDLIAGARQGASNITERAQTEQQNLAKTIGPNQPVNARAIYHGPLTDMRYTSSPLTTDPLQARLDILRNMAVEAQKPAFQAKTGPMPTGSVPYSRAADYVSNIGALLPNIANLPAGAQKMLYARGVAELRNAAVASNPNDPTMGDQFDAARTNYEQMLRNRGQLEFLGGKPVGGYDPTTSQQQGGTTAGTEYQPGTGKDEGQAYNWLKGNMNSPSALTTVSDPRVYPNEFWRQVSGGLISRLGQTPEGIFRPDWLAQKWGGGIVPQSTFASSGERAIDPDVKTQLMATPSGATSTDAATLDDLATLGRHSVVEQQRAGLANTAGTMLGVKYALGQLGKLGAFAGQAGGALLSAAGGRAVSAGLESPTFVNAVTGNTTPFLDALYSGVPAAAQNILQYQANPPQ